MPRRTGIQFSTTPQDPQLADLINVGDFQLWVHDAKPDSFDMITNLKLLLGVGSRTHPHSEFGIGSIKGSRYPKQVAEIRVAPFIEGTGQANPRLHSRNRSGPKNFAGPPLLAGLRQPWAFDTGLHNAVAIDKN